jgi:hypothetical protein
MKLLGYLLITVGFLSGALAASQTKADKINWLWFIPCAALGVAGVVIVRMQLRSKAVLADFAAAKLGDVKNSITEIVTRIHLLEAENKSLHPNDVHRRIDELFPEQLALFVNARASLGQAFGLQAYAEVMSEFAAGERYLNRAWSASVDGYIDEVADALARAKYQFQEAERKVRALF